MHRYAEFVRVVDSLNYWKYFKEIWEYRMDAIWFFKQSKSASRSRVFVLDGMSVLFGTDLLPQLRFPPKSSNGWGVKGLPPVGRISPYEVTSLRASFWKISSLEMCISISSPPKPLKTPPSPQKPQKTTSPKKKNGMLSPIKTPKTPGSDTRKLPPIKAPVGLAPNPNLKNIRSKIGSFDNIRYKPRW
ncbi:uncharacterized protein CEXT_655001 [Caerostris extrusa]|uniref:Uncharacterized protein n=1 Tax=Caerostris extrusa TaxID=172846 RepID=A0AAV4MBW4_CAEEX|nr:uncharacterized protein CEXT_655001 [Caerostris extrusa]